MFKRIIKQDTDDSADSADSTKTSTDLVAPHVYAEDPPDAAERKSILTGTAGYIIVTEFCERLTYYGTIQWPVYQLQCVLCCVDCGMWTVDCAR